MSAPNGAVRLVPADLAAHRPALLELSVEYVAWYEQVCEERYGLRLGDLLGVDARTYVEGSLDAMVTEAQLHGACYLLEVDGAAVGMGALRRSAEGVAEVKRMYVRPGHRGRRLGATLLARLVEDARSLGYDHVRLETGEFMASAHRTYEAVGFVDREPFEDAENPKELLPHLRFMELSLR